MGRRKGSLNRPKGDGATARAPAARKSGTVPVDHNKAAATEGLTDEQQQHLLLISVPKYEKALQAKKDAAAAFLDVCKKIKGDGVDLDDVKTAIKAKTPEGAEKIKLAIHAQMRVARWMGADLGSQFDFFRDDGEGEENASFKAGKIAGMEGAPAKAPSHFDVNQWLAGWQTGQAVNAAGFKEKAPDAPKGAADKPAAGMATDPANDF